MILASGARGPGFNSRSSPSRLPSSWQRRCETDKRRIARWVFKLCVFAFLQSFKLYVFAFLQSFKLYVFAFSQSFTLCVFAFCCAHERGRSSEQDQVTSGQWRSTAATRHTFFVSEACCLAAPSAGSSSTSSRDTFC